MNASECANHVGKYSFGLDEALTAEALRKLADEIEAGVVTLHSVTTSSHAFHEEFCVREIAIEVLEANPGAGPQMIRAENPK